MAAVWDSSAPTRVPKAGRIPVVSSLMAITVQSRGERSKVFPTTAEEQPILVQTGEVTILVSDSICRQKNKLIKTDKHPGLFYYDPTTAHCNNCKHARSITQCRTVPLPMLLSIFFFWGGVGHE